MNKNFKIASLCLKDGKIYNGYAFGADKPASGEVVFNTGMVGYPETLTDPSYCGQILVLTYPLIGNYGVPNDDIENGLSKQFESDKIHIKGLVISDYSFEYNHWNAGKSLDEWLKENNIPGIYNIDTRAITKNIREAGVMPGKLIAESTDSSKFSFDNPNARNLGTEVSTTQKEVYGNGKRKILLIDCGVKNSIIHCLINRDTTVIRVPWNHDISKETYDGIVISNGPGDPMQYGTTIKTAKDAMQGNKPIFGICLGNQILGIASGARTYKLKYGHRSQNQPCLEVGTQRCYITSQNHGYAIEKDSIPIDWSEWFTNLNDGTNEGIKHKTKPFFAVQFHPEAAPGPTDMEYLFEYFLNTVKK